MCGLVYTSNGKGIGKQRVHKMVRSVDENKSGKIVDRYVED